MLSTQSLSFIRKDQNLFQNLSFTVKPGEILQINGANGSGKTTLLRLLAGFLKPSSGDIQYLQISIFHPQNNYQAQIAYLGHANAIKPALTLKENLISHCKLMGASASLEIEPLLEAFQLQSVYQKLAYQLSAGQQRKLALIKIILTQKPIWILDEPLTALDESSIATLMIYLSKHLETGGIIITATHQALPLHASPIQGLSL